MNLATGVGWACGSVAVIAGAASATGLARRPTRRCTDRGGIELARLDAGFQASLRTQLETARRYDRYFTLTSTELDGGDPASVATACERHIRTLDAVTMVGGALVVLWGSTEQTEAATALERLIAVGALPPSSLARTGAASFPVDGFTAVSLTEAAAERVGTLVSSSFPAPPIRLHAVASAPPSARDESDRESRGELRAVGR